MSSGTDPRRMADAYRPRFGLPWAPVLPREQLERMGDSALVSYLNARKMADEYARANPVGSGWILPSWEKVMENWQKYPVHCICGGVRSSKSSLAARLCVWALGTIPEASIRCYHVNKDRSKQDQQPFIYEALPEGLRNLPTSRGKNHSVQYSQANGFTNNILILPPLEGWQKGGRIDFSNYASYLDDPRTAEGFKSHVLWLDEEAPVKLFDTLTYRTTDFHGRILLTFTTLDGWTPLVADIMTKVKTLEWRYSPYLKRKLPVLQESLSRKGCLIHYFWTDHNPFIDIKEFQQKLDGRSEEEILARAHGIPTKAAKAAFPKFSRDVNVVKHEDLPFVKDPSYPVTRYMIMDPGGNKRDFIVWVAVDAAGTRWCYRDWPDFETYGPWAEPGPTPDGKAGPAQKSDGMGIATEVELIKQLENGEKIFERLIDPRMGAAERKGEEGATTIITDFAKHDMIFIPAPGLDIKHGIKLINNQLDYNTEKPRDARNSPKLYFSERCENSIHMMSEYCNYSAVENTKETCDCLRYLETSSPQHFAETDMKATEPQGVY